MNKQCGCGKADKMKAKVGKPGPMGKGYSGKMGKPPAVKKMPSGKGPFGVKISKP